MTNKPFYPTVTVIADSINPAGNRVTTITAKYHRFFHEQVLTYRVLSRNSSSSRAIPVPRLIENIRKDNVMPLFWGKKQKGMSASEECNELVKHPRTGEMLTREEAWIEWREDNIAWAEAFDKAGYHKQITNRGIQNFSAITVIITATDWDNLFSQRIHPSAQPEFHALATEIKTSLDQSAPDVLKWGEWHIPFIKEEDIDSLYQLDLADLEADCGLLKNLLAIGTGRDARVSYLTHDGVRDLKEDIRLHERLKTEMPPHYSPFEHSSKALPGQWANLKGFCSYRHHLERDWDINTDPVPWIKKQREKLPAPEQIEPNPFVQ